MRTYKKTVKALLQSQYLQPVLSDNKGFIERAKLLQNGEIFQKNLVKQLLSSQSLPDRYDEQTLCDTKNYANDISFLNSKEFQTNYNEILRRFDRRQKSCFVFNKLVERSILSNDSKFLEVVGGYPRLLFISDYFVQSSRRLQAFYNIQRERKIWWMRYSADPSRYSVNTQQINMEGNDVKNSFLSKCQSIKIKSELSFCKLDIEHITLVALTDIKKFDNLPVDFSVIRSTVNIDIATYALLLNSIEQDGNYSLLLHRHLSPFQLMLIQNIEKKNKEADDLCSHILHVFRRAGLRVLGQFPHAHHTGILKDVLSDADKLGVNYTIIINDDTLLTGRFYLRNRDTGLCETIHISDLPTYLVNIFSC